MSGWAYILSCADDSLYVGSTSHTDVASRVAEHNEGRYFGYTNSRRPVRLVWAKHFDDLTDAHATERRIKGWSRAKKLALIKDNEKALFALSSRRAGNPKVEPKPAKRQLATRFQEASEQILAADNASASRKHANVDSTRGSNMSYIRLANSRHPEVRPKGAPKDG